MYPIERYKFFRSGPKTIAVSSYAGRTVKGVSKCDSRDTFSQEKGRELAAARCELKVAEKRLKRATQKREEAMEEFERSAHNLSEMHDYYFSARDKQREAEYNLREVLARCNGVE